MAAKTKIKPSDISCKHMFTRNNVITQTASQANFFSTIIFFKDAVKLHYNLMRLFLTVTDS